MTVYGAIFARGGSKGVPGKNLRLVGGRSLLAHAVIAGQEAELVDSIHISTDADDISAEAAALGVQVPFRRPVELSRDDSPEWDAWEHLARHLINQGAAESDLLVSIPPTSPLRIPGDIDQAISAFRDGTFDVILAVTESTRSPWFNMVTRGAQGRVELAAAGDNSSIVRRQDAPPVFSITTVVYVTTLGFVCRASRMFDGTVGSITVPPERAIDIDTELDLEIADCLARKRLGLQGE